MICCFLRSFIPTYSITNEKIANAALNKFKNHLWYISDELIALAYFDDSVSFETKEEMIDALKNEADADPPKKTTVDQEYYGKKQLWDFVTANTVSFFDTLGLSSTFLDTSVEDWLQAESYCIAKSVVNDFKVVNDITERGVKLMED